MSEIKHIFIDLDDTLMDFKAAERDAIGAVLRWIGREPTDSLRVRYSEINREMWRRLERGEITRDKLRTERFTILFSELGATASAEKALELYETTLSRAHYLIDGALPLLETLSKKYMLYLASNGTAHVQKPRIEAAGIGKYFKEIFISETVGYNKPSREFFDCCFSKTEGLRKDEVIFVGDSISSDIRGGINAGILTCLYNAEGKTPPADAIPNYEIKALEELPALLERI